MDERRPSARVVAVLRLFDLQHLGAHVAEHHRAERTGHHARQVDHAKAVEGSHMAQQSTSHTSRPRARDATIAGCMTFRIPPIEKAVMWRAAASMFSRVGSKTKPSRSAMGFFRI